MALESFSGSNLEAFIDSGLEARGRFGPQLIVVVALDEASAYFNEFTGPDEGRQRYLDDLALLRAAQVEASSMMIKLSPGVLDYDTWPTAGGAGDSILPKGIAFPHQDVRLIAENLPRSEPFSEITETPQEYVEFFESISFTPGLGVGSRIVFLQDASNSMTAATFMGIPQQALDLLEIKYPGLETRLTFMVFEFWLSAIVAEFNSFVADHP